jgi:hypothetical protein
MRRLCLTVLLLLLSVPARPQVQGINPSVSSVTVRVFKSGLFSAFAHDHTVAAPLGAGHLDLGKRSIELSFHTHEMKVTDKDVSDSDRSEIEHTMKSDKVLDVEKFPEITFVSTSVEAGGRGRFRVRGNLNLHGIVRPIEMPVSLQDGWYSGSVKLKQTDYGITPIRIAGGAVRVKDEIEVAFVIAPAK